MNEPTMPDVRKTGYSQEEKWAYLQNQERIRKLRERRDGDKPTETPEPKAEK